VLPKPGRRLLLTGPTQTFPHTCYNLFAAGEEDKDEETLEGVEHEEDIPDRLNVQTSSKQSSSPAESHQGGKSEVKSETCFRPARRDLRRAVRRLPHQAGRVDEEEEVEGEDDGEWDDEVDHQSCSRPKPADPDGRSTELGSVLARQVRDMKEVKEDGNGNEKCRCQPSVD